MKIEVDLEKILIRIEQRLTAVENNTLRLQTKFNIISFVAGGFGTVVGAVAASYFMK